MRQLQRVFIPVSLALFVLAIVLLVLQPQLPVIEAAPDLVKVEVITLNSSAIATTTVLTGEMWSARGSDSPPTIAEIYWFIDVGVVNTTTFVLQVSPDNSTWVDHSTSSALVSNVVADTNSYTRTTIEGVYYRVVATTSSNGETLTPTIKVLLR